MKRYATLILTALAAVALDSAVFVQWTLYGVRPLLLLAAALAACAALNVQSAILTAFLGGLVLDALTNSYLGLEAACNLLAVSVLWLLIRKNHPKRFVLFLYFCLCAALCTPLEWLYSYLLGAHHGGLQIWLTRALPSAVLTGAAALPIDRLFRRVSVSRRDRI